jgi:phthalate 4,5-dioxygenase
MTTASENELLTQVGPGMPMGRFMREYWIPACMSSELKTDGPPVRLLLLCEKLIAFRDTAGQVGVFDHRCPHRCASLFFGRNDAGGLRCIYHGWKFDVKGNCVDMPNIPRHQNFQARVKAKAYQVAERGGVVYVYMGERKVAPPLPDIEPLLFPAEDTTVGCRQRQCNWLQAAEGDLDTSHFGFLHAGSVSADDIDPDNIDRFQIANRAPEYEIRETHWGTMYGAYRSAHPGFLYYRFAHFVMPHWTLYPNGMLSQNITSNAWVPMDDTHTMVFNIGWKRRIAPLANLKNGESIPGMERNVQFLPNTDDWYGRWRSVVNADNDYMLDRDVQRNLSFSGIPGIVHQDMAVTESMGGVVDRTFEHLGPSDRMIIITRRRLLKAVRAFIDHGTTPPLVDDPASSRSARGGDVIVPEGQDWLSVYKECLESSGNAVGIL